MNWQTVYIFISSTFNDMHAERDHLVKQVFPQLRIWCAQRKLKLVDVDLRWGVSAADAEENKRVVEVCMKNIDKCRPFFLCFMGQRRGWVPEDKDINPETLRLFPELSKYIGKSSVTELEILHALMHPFSENAIPVKHSRFYFRDKNYLKQIQTEAHKNLFCPKRGFLAKGDSDLEQFKKEIAKQYPVVEYSASWNATKPSPEFTDELSKGRLENFRTKQTTLSDDIITWLKKEISLAYPEHLEVSAASDPLDIELDRQDTQLFLASDGYIPRPHEEGALVELINEPENTPILLLADAGCGKTSLLARIINQNKEHISLYYRFIGTTPDSFRIEDIAASLAKQWVRDGLLTEKDIDHPENELALFFPNLIAKAGKKKNITVILDGIDQIAGGFKTSYLPRALPNHSHLIVSMRSDSPDIPTENVRVHTLGMMSEREDKVQMIEGYLSTFFKDVDEKQLEQIVSMDGSSNPLYLKIVLNELRQHGSFDTLFEMLTKNYGATPIEAFEQMITRVTDQIQQLGISNNFANVFFGCLSVAQAGLNGKMLNRGIHLLDNSGVENLSDEELNDLFNSLGRELEPFFIFDGDKLSMRYNSMCRAVQNMNDFFVTVSHTLNAGIFGLCALDEDNTEYMKHSLYHLAEAQEQFVYRFFSSPEPIMWILKRMGTVPLIRTLRDLGEKRNLADFAHLAEFFSKAAARLETYPETLFTELTRYANMENTIVKQLLAQRDNFEKTHFVPLNQSTSQDILIREYALPQEKLYGFAYNDPYYIVYEDDHLKVIDRRTNDMVNILFRHDTGRYGLCRIAAGDDLLYVSYWGMGGLKDGFNYCECYTLPDLSFVSRIDTLNVEYTSVYELFVREGKLYGYFNHMLGKFGDLEEKRTEQAIVCISTNEILFKEVFTGSGTHHVLGEHITLYDHGSGYWQIIRIKDGKVLVKEHFVGEDGQLIKHPLAGAANLYAARVENLLCVYMSGGNVEKDGDKLRLTNEHKTLLYNVLEDGSLETNTDITVPEGLQLSYIHDCSKRYFFATQKNTVTVYTKKLEPLGGIKISGHPGLIRNFSPSIVETNDGDLIVFTDLSVQTYHLEKLIAAASSDSSKTSHTKCDGLVKDGSFYVFGPKVEKYDLQALEKTDSIGDPIIIQFICPWNVRPSHEECVMTAVNGKNYSVFYFDPNNYGVKHTGAQTMEFEVEGPDKNVLLHAFGYTNEDEQYILGNVVADKELLTHTFKGQNYTFYRCRLLLLKNDDTLKNRWFEYDLNVEVMGSAPYEAGVKSIICNGKTYLVFSNVYVNDKKLGFTVYDVAAKSMLYSVENESIVGPFKESNLNFYENGLTLNYVEGGKRVFELFDAKEMRRLRDANDVHLFDQPIRDGYVYIRIPKEMKVLLFSLKERQTVKSFELTERNIFNVQQFLTVENMILVRNSMSDILEVYDFESGEKLFDQRMEKPLEDLFYDSNTKRLVSLDSDRNVSVWEIKK